MDPKPWTEELLFIKKKIEPHAGVNFNSVLINYYRDGRDRVAWHSDDEKELGQKIQSSHPLAWGQNENSNFATSNTSKIIYAMRSCSDMVAYW